MKATTQFLDSYEIESLTEQNSSLKTIFLSSSDVSETPFKYNDSMQEGLGCAYNLQDNNEIVSVAYETVNASEIIVSVNGNTITEIEGSAANDIWPILAYAKYTAFKIINVGDDTTPTYHIISIAVCYDQSKYFRHRDSHKDPCKCSILELTVSDGLELDEESASSNVSSEFTFDVEDENGCDVDGKSCQAALSSAYEAQNNGNPLQLKLVESNDHHKHQITAYINDKKIGSASHKEIDEISQLLPFSFAVSLHILKTSSEDTSIPIYHVPGITLLYDTPKFNLEKNTVDQHYLTADRSCSEKHFDKDASSGKKDKYANIPVSRLKLRRNFNIIIAAMFLVYSLLLLIGKQYIACVVAVIFTVICWRSFKKYSLLCKARIMRQA